MGILKIVEPPAPPVLVNIRESKSRDLQFVKYGCSTVPLPLASSPTPGRKSIPSVKYFELRSDLYLGISENDIPE